MKLRTLFTIIALVGGACLTGCVAQVGQGDDRTGTARSSLGNEGEPQEEPGDTNGQNQASDPSSDSTIGDNQGPQPLPWTATGGSGPSGGAEEKKK